MKRISEITRRDIIDIIKSGFNRPKDIVNGGLEDSDNNDVVEYKIYHFGRLSEIDFLSRIYTLSEMPSTDSRFQDAQGDIWQHTINNDDWDFGWVFTDRRFKLTHGNDDEYLLRFLCEMFHPIVRDEAQPWQEFVKIFNELLKHDGYELYENEHISGRAVYGWREFKESIIETPSERSHLSYELKLHGEGSYAYVFKYKDTFYDLLFAVKRAKDDLDEKEIERFKREYSQMKSFDSPYIVKVYCYNDERNEYIMEYMDSTLDKYIIKNNGKLTFKQRKNIGLQLLKGIEYIHRKDLLHRDLCPKNILIKQFDDITLVKISDFGLVKTPNSQLTSVSTEYKGYFNDPGLVVEGFNTYNIVHETYAISRILFFILTGRTNTSKISNSYIKDFIDIGLNTEKTKRYQNIEEVKEAFLGIKDE